MGLGLIGDQSLHEKIKKNPINKYDNFEDRLLLQFTKIVYYPQINLIQKGDKNSSKQINSNDY